MVRPSVNQIIMVSFKLSINETLRGIEVEGG